MILTEAIRLYCKEYNISIRELAALTGISHPMAQRFLEGKAVNSKSFAKLLTWTMQKHQ